MKYYIAFIFVLLLAGCSQAEIAQETTDEVDSAALLEKLQTSQSLDGLTTQESAYIDDLFATDVENLSETENQIIDQVITIGLTSPSGDL